MSGQSSKRCVLEAVDLDAMVQRQEGCNVQNLPEFLPYCLVGKGSSAAGELHIEREWWEDDLLEETRGKIRAIAAEGGLRVAVVDALPEHGARASNIGRPWTALYKAVFEQYEYNKWAPPMQTVLPSVRLVEIPPQVQRELARVAKIKVLTGRSLKAHDLEDLREEPFFQTLSDALRAVGDRAFVKMPTTSSKNEQKMRPVVGAADCVDYITNTHCFAAELAEAQATYLIILPWLEDLDRSHEYRAFVHRGRITAISQQQWYARHFASEEPVRADAEALLAFFDSKLQGLMPYKSGVLDMWVRQRGGGGGSSTNTDAERGAAHQDGEGTGDGLEGRFIEINPWGAGFSSGSSLFHWRRDFDVLYGRSQAEAVTVRYVGKAWEGGTQAELIEFVDDLHLKDK